MAPSAERIEGTLGRELQAKDILVHDPADKNLRGEFYEVVQPRLEAPSTNVVWPGTGIKPVQARDVMQVQKLTVFGPIKEGEIILSRKEDYWTGVIPRECRRDFPSNN
jgi:hypothetical protein